MSAAAAHSRRYREDDLPSRQYLPPTEDPRWKRWCAPLLAHIKACPRTWAELRAWEKTNEIRPGLLLAMVSWLEFNHRITAVMDGDPLLWCADKESDPHDLEAMKVG